ncbi:MAG: FMN-dependent NADH-azoreductase [Chromatiales bacterium 21-64-14]|nr:MAG: FMN-dependent NADH-azoreductase [Chromatiales bacterium 21-64-14]HQU14670.1 NAD(P)H-dependent oxidoreductase [Gammaproteobacteria bacterium]
MSRIQHPIAQPTDYSTPLRVLRVDASGRTRESVSRQLTDRFIEGLTARHPHTQVAVRDVATGLPFVDEAWIQANFTAPEERTGAQRAALAQSDTLVQELMDANLLVMGVPVYNFGVPAALKAWIDLVARARLTFRYTENGPVGLLQGRKAYLMVASGGTAVGSEIDFAIRYLRHILGFLGITDVEVIAAERLMAQGESALSRAHTQLGAALEHLPVARTDDAA